VTHLRRAVSVLALILACCVPFGTSTHGAPAPASAAPTLRLAMPDTSLEVDPALVADEPNVQLANLMYSGLVRLDSSYHVVKDLASSIRISKDRRTYVFAMRSNARFSNGDPVVADDVRYSIERSLNPALKSPTSPTYLIDIAGAYEYVTGKAKSVSGVKVLGPHTVQITTRWPVPYFLMELTYPTSYVLDEKLLKSGPIDSTSWYSNPVGSGPYKLKSWVQSKVDLVPNKYFVGPKPALSHITISLSSLPTTAIYQYLTHSVDVVSLPQYDHTLVHNTGIREQRMLAVDGVYMNLQSKLFKSLALRRALTLALNRPAIVKGALGGSATPFLGSVPRDQPGYYSGLRPLGFSPSQAQANLKAAGYPGGKKFPSLTLYYREDPAVQQLAGLIVASWHKYLHINVAIQGLTLNTLFAQVQANKLPIYLFGWLADYPDPHDLLSLQWETGALNNNVRYSDAHFDKLVEAADVTWNTKNRMSLYNQAQQVLVDDAAWIPLYIPHRLVYVRPTVVNLAVTGYGVMPKTGSWAQVQVRKPPVPPSHR
jgi:ABC-type oligopeptide transport system substrate-binding subunit